MRRWLVALVAVLGLAGTGVAAVAPAAAASTSCQVINKQTRASYNELQTAINTAAVGGTLFVRGICGTSEGFAISQNLTLIGQHPAGYPAPTLDSQSGGYFVNSVLATSATVTVKSLTITGGYSGEIGVTGGAGGGVFNSGALTLIATRVTGNTAFTDGGGIFNSGTVTLKGSTVTGNTALFDGGGIFNSGTVTLEGSTITGNTASADGGGIFNAEGMLNGARDGVNVSGNTPDNIA